MRVHILIGIDCLLIAKDDSKVLPLHNAMLNCLLHIHCFSVDENKGRQEEKREVKYWKDVTAYNDTIWLYD